jgi:hypothetical protein
VVPKQRIGFLTYAKAESGEQAMQLANGTLVSEWVWAAAPAAQQQQEQRQHLLQPWKPCLHCRPSHSAWQRQSIPWDRPRCQALLLLLLLPIADPAPVRRRCCPRWRRCPG